MENSLEELNNNVIKFYNKKYENGVPPKESIHFNKNEEKKLKNFCTEFITIIRYLENKKLYSDKISLVFDNLAWMVNFIGDGAGTYEHLLDVIEEYYILVLENHMSFNEYMKIGEAYMENSLEELNSNVMKFYNKKYENGVPSIESIHFNKSEEKKLKNFCSEFIAIIRYLENKKLYFDKISLVFNNLAWMVNFIEDGADRYEHLVNVIEEYYILVLEDHIPFNRTTIPTTLIYTDKSDTNRLLEVLRQNVKDIPLTVQEKNIALEFNEDDRECWEYVGLIKRKEKFKFDNDNIWNLGNIPKDVLDNESEYIEIKKFVLNLLKNANDERFITTSKETLNIACLDDALWEDIELLNELKQYYYRLFDNNRHFHIVCLPNALRENIDFLYHLYKFLYKTEDLLDYCFALPLLLYKDKEFKEYVKQKLVEAIKKDDNYYPIPEVFLKDTEIIELLKDNNKYSKLLKYHNI